MFFRKKVKEKEEIKVQETVSEQKQQFRNVLEFARGLLDYDDRYKEFEKENIYYFIKMLTDKMIYTNAIELIKTHEGVKALNIQNCFLENSSIIYDDITFSQFLEQNVIDTPIKFDLESTAIITTPWKYERLQDDFIDIHKDKWKLSESNHVGTLLLPMNLFIVENGNHSIFIGVVKHYGEFEINTPKSSGSNKAYDLSKLYDYIYCDGEYYRRKSDESIIEPVKNFEIACIFEIGRYILLYKKSEKKQEEYRKKIEFEKLEKDIERAKIEYVNDLLNGQKDLSSEHKDLFKENSNLSKEHSSLSKEHDDLKQLLLKNLDISNLIFADKKADELRIERLDYKCESIIENVRKISELSKTIMWLVEENAKLKEQIKNLEHENSKLKQLNLEKDDLEM